MSLIKDLLERPFDQAITSKYTAMNGLVYLGAGTLVLVWPGMVQTILRDAASLASYRRPRASPAFARLPGTTRQAQLLMILWKQLA
jgi:hypothetical protein